MLKTYNKLVRDNIPKIIEQSGKSCAIRVLDDDEYLKALSAKLSEEVEEYLQSGSPEELADIIEVAQALAVANGCTAERLESIRKAKAAERGAFEKKIMLQTVSDGD